MSIQDIYFSKNEIELKKKVYLQRKYKIPVSNGWIYQEYEKMYSTNWSKHSTATGVTIDSTNNKIIFNDVYDGGIKGKFGTVGSVPVIDSNKNAYIKVEIEIRNYLHGTLLLAYGTVTDVGNVKFLRDPNERYKYYALVCTQSIMPNTNFILYSNDGFTGEITYGGAVGAKLYEDVWQDISQYLISKSLSTRKNLDTKSWEFGEVQQDNMKLSFININRELSDETNTNSLFYNGFIKHQSKIKVGIALNNEESTIFEGLIDERSCSSSTDKTALIKEDITIFSYFKLFSDITLAEIGAITSSLTNTISKAVDVIIGYGAFRYFMQKEINVLKDVDIDLSQYDSTESILNILKDLAKGQSAFWVDNNNIFNFKNVQANDTIIEFGSSFERRIKVYDFSAGADRVIENFYWKDSSEKYISRQIKYNTSKEIDISAITDSYSRQEILNSLGSNFASKQKQCKLDIPLAPFIQIFDVVKFLDNKNIGVSDLSQVEFVVYGISHNDNKTTLTLVEKKKTFYIEDTNIRSNTHLRTNIYDDYVPYDGIYNFVLKGEAGLGGSPSSPAIYGQANYSARGATGTLKLRLTKTDKLTVRCIVGGRGEGAIPVASYHGGCGIAIFVNDVLICAIGGGGSYYTSQTGTAIWIGGGGYRGGDSYAVYNGAQEPSPYEYAGYGYDYDVQKLIRNTSTSELASGGSLCSNYYGYGGSGYINLDSEYLEEFSYINGSNTNSGSYVTPDGNAGQGFVSIEYSEQ